MNVVSENNADSINWFVEGSIADVTIKNKSNSSQFAYGIIFDGSTPKEPFKQTDEAQWIANFSIQFFS